MFAIVMLFVKIVLVKLLMAFMLREACTQAGATLGIEFGFVLSGHVAGVRQSALLSFMKRVMRLGQGVRLTLRCSKSSWSIAGPKMATHKIKGASGLF